MCPYECLQELSLVKHRDLAFDRKGYLVSARPPLEDFMSGFSRVNATLLSADTIALAAGWF
jgi:hypothetical protein